MSVAKSVAVIGLVNLGTCSVRRVGGNGMESGALLCSRARWRKDAILSRKPCLPSFAEAFGPVRPYHVLISYYHECDEVDAGNSSGHSGDISDISDNSFSSDELGNVDESDTRSISKFDVVHFV